MVVTMVTFDLRDGLQLFSTILYVLSNNNEIVAKVSTRTDCIFKF